METSCEICDGTEFQMVDNMHCCSQCGTVNQSMGTFLEQEEGYQETFNPLKITCVRKRKEPKARKQKIHESGRPWKSDEGFQFIIMQQVEALIALGAPPNLKIVAFNIWASYLRETGRSFCKSSHLQYKKPLFVTKRDKYLGMMENNKIVNMDYFISTKSLWFKKKLFEMDSIVDDGGMFENDNDQNDNEDTPDEEQNLFSVDKNCSSDFSFLRDETYLNPDYKKPKNIQEMEKMFATERHLDAIEDEQEKLFLKIVKNEQRKRDEENKKQIEKLEFDADRQLTLVKNEPTKQKRWAAKMSVIKCLAITYLALQATNSHILLHDLIRLVIRGKVPFYHFVNWPQDMFFYSNDYESFNTYRNPTVGELSSQAQSVVKFAKLHCFKKVDMAIIVARFCLELHLPVELMRVVNHLFNLHEPSFKMQKSTYRCHKPALVAMAYIVFIMKLLFGIDDVTEIRISRAVQRIQKHFHLEKALFSWLEWVEHSEKSFLKKRTSSGVKNLRDMAFVTKVSDVMKANKDEFIEEDRVDDVDRFNKILTKDVKSHQNATASNSSNWYKKRLEMLYNQRNVLYKLKGSLTKNKHDDGNDNENFSDDDKDFIQNEKEREARKGHCTTPTCSQYNYCSLSYLLDPLAFCQKLSQLSKSECSRHCLQEHRLSSSERKLSHIIRDFQAEINIETPPWKRYLLQKDKISRKKLIKKYTLQTIDFDAVTLDKVNVQSRVKKRKVMSCSMQWLLERCASHILSSADEVHDWLKCLEEVYLKDVMNQKVLSHMLTMYAYKSLWERKKFKWDKSLGKESKSGLETQVSQSSPSATKIDIKSRKKFNKNENIIFDTPLKKVKIIDTGENKNDTTTITNNKLNNVIEKKLEPSIDSSEKNNSRSSSQSKDRALSNQLDESFLHSLSQDNLFNTSQDVP